MTANLQLILSSTGNNVVNAFNYNRHFSMEKEFKKLVEEYNFKKLGYTYRRDSNPNIAILYKKPSDFIYIQIENFETIKEIFQFHYKGGELDLFHLVNDPKALIKYKDGLTLIPIIKRISENLDNYRDGGSLINIYTLMPNELQNTMRNLIKYHDIMQQF